jgi:diadenylate cyclase
MQISDYIPALMTVRSFVDIAFVYIIVYVVLRLLRGTRAVPTMVGLVILALLYWLAVAQDLATLEFVLRSAVFYIPLLIIVLFASEIRQALIYFGNRLRLPLVRQTPNQRGETIYDEIVLAATTLSAAKTGALIVIERGVGLRNFIDAGVELDARLSYDLLVTLFDPSTPLHDGAVIISQERVAAASCFLPLTKNPNISRELGTRHRAAIGITEGSDSISVTVSEETGMISFTEQGVIQRNLDTKTLRSLLLESMEVPLLQQHERFESTPDGAEAAKTEIA